MDKIKTGKYKIISSGSFIASEKEKSEILFKRGNEKITLEIIFKEKKEKKVETSSRGSKEDIIISFELPSVKNILGEGLVNPMQFAKFDNGDLLYLHFWIRKISEAYVEIVYSIYVEEIQKWLQYQFLYGKE